MSLAIVTDCFDDAIGLSRTDCSCFDVPVNESKSGLFIDELEGLDLKTINAAVDCGTGSLFDYMKRAREQATKIFKSEYSSVIAANWNESRTSFKGVIGRQEASANKTISQVAGLRFIFSNVKNGLFVINRIGTMFSQTGTITLNIYNNISDAPLYTISGLNTTANGKTWNTLNTPIELPMYSTETDYIEYYFVYSDPGFPPRENGLKCCSTNLYFNCLEPQLQLNISDMRYQFAKWCNVTGVTGADIDTLKGQNIAFTNCAYGLLVDSEMKCDSLSYACNDADFKHSQISLVMAYAIWFRAGVFLCDYILSSAQINRYTMLDRERLYAKKNSYMREYKDRITWLANPDVDIVKRFLLDTGCVVCNSRMSMGSML